ncbi:hypothetical protein ACHAXS_002505, partial [Conticribra weissflogii]
MSGLEYANEDGRPTLQSSGLHTETYEPPASLRQTVGNFDANMTTEYVTGSTRPSIINPYGDRRLTTRTSVQVNTAKLENRRKTIAKRATRMT